MNVLIARASWAAVALTVGCGGIVNFSPDGGEGGTGGSGAVGPGQGGGPGQGAGPGQGGGPGVGAAGPGPNTSVVTTGPQKSPCEVACSLDCPDQPPDCVASCEANIPPTCFDEYGALLDCVIPFLGPDCVFEGDVCQAEADAFSQCFNDPFCEETGCIGDMLACECEAACGPQTALIHCEQLVPSGVQCDCFVDGEFFGSCQQEFLECGFQLSCCEDILF